MKKTTPKENLASKSYSINCPSMYENIFFELCNNIGFHKHEAITSIATQRRAQNIIIKVGYEKALHICGLMNKGENK